MGDMQLKPELVQELCAFARERKIQKLMIFGRGRGETTAPRATLICRSGRRCGGVYGRREREGTDAAVF